MITTKKISNKHFLILLELCEQFCIFKQLKEIYQPSKLYIVKTVSYDPVTWYGEYNNIKPVLFPLNITITEPKHATLCLLLNYRKYHRWGTGEIEMFLSCSV